MTEAFIFSFDLKSGYHLIEVFEGHHTSISLGRMAALISLNFTCLQICLLVYRPHLTFSPRLLSLWKNIGDIRAYVLLFFLTMAGP